MTLTKERTGTRGKRLHENVYQSNLIIILPNYVTNYQKQFCGDPQTMGTLMSIREVDDVWPRHDDEPAMGNPAGPASGIMMCRIKKKHHISNSFSILAGHLYLT